MDIDASYKINKKCAKSNGSPIFGCTETATNEFNEIRLQFFAFSDSLEQMELALDSYIETLDAMGQLRPKRVKVDNPEQVKVFYDRKLKLEKPKAKPRPRPQQHTQLPYDRSKVQLLSSKVNIETFAESLVSHVDDMEVEHVVMGFDAEWNTTTNTAGEVVSSEDCVAVIQIAYEIGSGPEMCVLQLSALQILPPELQKLLCHSKITFTGRQLGGDVAQLQKTFPEQSLQDMKVLELGLFCRLRMPQKVPHGRVGLGALCEAVLGHRLDKPTDILISTSWSMRPLSDAHIDYAAQDVLASLLIYKAAAEMPDPTVRLDAATAALGTSVEIYPTSGTVSEMSLCVGTGEVIQASGAIWELGIRRRIG